VADAEIRIHDHFDDPRAHAVERQAAQYGMELSGLQVVGVVHAEGLTTDEAQTIGSELIADPNTQHLSLEPRTDWGDPHVVEVAPLPGVTNPKVDSIKYGAGLLGIALPEVATGTEYRFSPETPWEVVDRVVHTILVNPTVEQVRRRPPDSLAVERTEGHIRSLAVRTMDDGQLMALSKDRKLALNLREMQAIRAEATRLGRDLRDGEVEYLAAAWSEHCGHKTMKSKLIVAGERKASPYDRIKTGSRPYFAERGVLSAFHDNSGVFAFYEGQGIAIKLETHNSPHMIDPEGGAATGVGGVLRDVVMTGTGARAINSMHMSFTAPPDMPPEQIPPKTLSPAQILTGSVRGVGGYGNPMGIPTNNGSYHAHPNYRGKSSILVGSMGIMPEQHAEKGVPQYGDLVVAVGAKTGRDGLHGATFSSESAHADTAALHSGAVQIGDPIAEKKMFDAILEASQKGLIRAMTDCGAAGFASAIGELGEDIGVRIDLARAPLKYQGLDPWEIFLSESQERGVLAIDPAHESEIAAIFAKHGSSATTLGVFGTAGNEPKLEVLYNDEAVVDLTYGFIKEGGKGDVLAAEWTPPELPERRPEPILLEEALAAVLSDWNVCSRESITRQYDHEVQGASAMTPYSGVHGDAPNNAAVMTPILGKEYAVVQAHGCNPALSDLDPRRGSIWSYVEGMSNFVAAGGNPDDAVIVNNYIAASPTPRVMGALDRSVDALLECVQEFRTPIISGKDSLSSTYKYPDGTVLESPYNLVITVAGKIPDVAKTVSTDIKKPGSTLVFLGNPDYKAMGGSIFYDRFGGSSAEVPEVDLSTFHQTCTALHQAMQSGGVLAAHDVSEGGLAVTVSEMAFGGDCGAALDLEHEAPLRNLLFNETAGGFVVEVASAEVAEELFGDVPHQVIGTTTSQKTLHIRYNGKDAGAVGMDALKQAWKRPLAEVLA